MANHNLYTLSDSTATAITPAGSHSGMDITIQNVNSSGYIYIGATENVSSENYGYRLLPNQAWSIELSGKDDIYLIASESGIRAAVFTASLEVGY